MQHLKTFEIAKSKGFGESINQSINQSINLLFSNAGLQSGSHKAHIVSFIILRHKKLFHFCRNLLKYQSKGQIYTLHLLYFVAIHRLFNAFFWEKTGFGIVMKKLCRMRDFREKKSGNAGSGPQLPEGYPSKRVIPSWKAKDNPGLQAKFHR